MTKRKEVLRQSFESQYKNINKSVNLERAEDGGYCNQNVEHAWALFCASHNRGKQARIQGENHVRKPFIIGRMEEGRPRLSKSPYCHSLLGEAEEEADRLHDKYGHTFGVFGLVALSERSTEAPPKHSPTKFHANPLVEERFINALVKKLEAAGPTLAATTEVLTEWVNYSSAFYLVTIVRVANAALEQTRKDWFVEERRMVISEAINAHIKASCP